MKKYLIILILTLIGFSSALYLSIPAYEYWNGENSEALQAMPCDISDTLSCSGILKNPRAIIFEIGKIIQEPCPVSIPDCKVNYRPFKVAFPMIALVVYPILAILALIGYFSRKILFAKIITVMAIGGMAFNGYVISQEIIVGVFCPVCALCTIIITTIAILGGFIWREE
jgi:uncharacterized membrane protein